MTDEARPSERLDADPDPRVTLPGDDRRQTLLRAITQHYAAQPWALALLLFGSLARGNWDACSDLDLDVVIADGVQLDPLQEVERLCAAIGERPAVIATRRGDDADVVLASLVEFSIRYHPLAATSPNIIDSMRPLFSRLDIEAIRAAGHANARPPVQDLSSLVGLALRETLEARNALARGRVWSALAALESFRDALMTVYARTHSETRPLQTFERSAPPALQTALASTVARFVWDDARRAALVACDLLATQLDAFTAGQVALTPGQRTALGAIHQTLTQVEAP